MHKQGIRRFALGLAVGALVCVTGHESAASQGVECTSEEVAYQNQCLILDPDDGQIQFLVAEMLVETRTTLSGQTTNETVILAEFESNGDTFEHVRDTEPWQRVGVLANADVGDTFGLRELTDAD